MVSVACAIIEHKGKILAAQRSAVMANPMKWEFPGGKIEKTETAEECLLREIKEEMGIQISIHKNLEPVLYSYPDWILKLHPFICRLESGEIALAEHMAYEWLEPDALESLDWSAADLPVLTQLLSHIRFSE